MTSPVEQEGDCDAHSLAEYTGITPRLIFRDAAAAIDFYNRAFGAIEHYRLTELSGKIGHADLQIGSSRLMLADEYPDFGALSAQTIGGCPIRLAFYTTEVDALVARAVAAGALLLRPIGNIPQIAPAIAHPPRDRTEMSGQ